MTKYYMRQRRRSTSPIGRLAEYQARQTLAAADPALYSRLYAPQQYKQLLRWQAIGDYMGSYLGGGKSTPLAITNGQGENAVRDRNRLKLQLRTSEDALANTKGKLKEAQRLLNAMQEAGSHNATQQEVAQYIAKSRQFEELAGQAKEQLAQVILQRNQLQENKRGLQADIVAARGEVGIATSQFQLAQNKIATLEARLQQSGPVRVNSAASAAGAAADAAAALLSQGKTAQAKNAADAGHAMLDGELPSSSLPPQSIPQQAPLPYADWLAQSPASDNLLKMNNRFLEANDLDTKSFVGKLDPVKLTGTKTAVEATYGAYTKRNLPKYFDTKDLKSVLWRHSNNRYAMYYIRDKQLYTKPLGQGTTTKVPTDTPGYAKLFAAAESAK